MELEPSDRSGTQSCLICGLHRMLTLHSGVSDYRLCASSGWWGSRIHPVVEHKETRKKVFDELAIKDLITRFADATAAIISARYGSKRVFVIGEPPHGHEGRTKFMAAVGKLRGSGYARAPPSQLPATRVTIAVVQSDLECFFRVD